jgi:hypothetical protein
MRKTLKKKRIVFIKLLDVVMVMVCSLNVVHFFMKEKEEERGKVVKICDYNNNKTILSCCLWVEGALLLLHCSGGPLSVCLYIF